MLAFERFLEPSFACNIGKVILCVTDPCLALGNGAPAFDASGDRVKGYMKVVRAASILRSINLHLSRSQPYLFEPLYYSTNENISRIQTVLRQQKQRHAVLAKASGFMRASVLSIRGRRPKSKLNCLPVLQDDEVTNEGMQHVAMKMCLHGRLLVQNPDVTAPLEGSEAVVPRTTEAYDFHMPYSERKRRLADK